MAVLQMQRFSICAMKKDRKAILEELQILGILEIDAEIQEDKTLKRMDTLESQLASEKNAVLADHALEVLQEYAPEKTSMFSSFGGKQVIDKATYDKTAKERGNALNTVNRILDMNKQITEKKASIVKLETQLEELIPWLPLDVPMNTTGTKSTAVIIGSIGKVMTMEEIYTGVAEAAPGLEAFDLQMISADKDQVCLVALCAKPDAAKLEEALRVIGFARPSHATSKVPARKKEILEGKIADLKKEIEEISGQIAKFDSCRQELKMLSDYFRTRAQKYHILGELHQSRETFFLTGYIPAKQSKALEQKLSEKYDVAVDIEEVAEEEDVPVALENGKLGGSVEGVLSSFGLPAKGEIDPSKVMAIFYIFLFGLMLSDAAYGLILFTACFVMLKKFPRMSESMAKSLRLFMYCGLSTLFWGVMFGGYFGDIVNVVSRTYLGHEVSIEPLWFAPLNDPMRLLIYSMVFGLIHLFTGLALKGYMYIRDKKYLDFFCDVVLWFVFLIGLIMLLIPSSLFASIIQKEIVFSPALSMLSKILAIGGAVGLLLMSGRANKNPVLRIALGAYDLYNITGWLSDVLSYSRLLALGLATGVIASVVNQMGSMLGNSVLGTIVFIIVFIFGHIFNLAINLLGAYVHTNRLQYVEFFGKFYEGGGRAFAPFRADTKYVDIKEETKL